MPYLSLLGEPAATSEGKEFYFNICMLPTRRRSRRRRRTSTRRRARATTRKKDRDKYAVMHIGRLVTKSELWKGAKDEVKQA